MKRLFALLLLLSLAPISAAALVTDGLIIHLEADTLGTANGSRVNNWANSAGAGLTGLVAANATVYNRPRMVTNAINGHKAVDFTYDDDNGDGLINSTDKRNYLTSGATTWNWNASLGVTMIIVGQGGDFGLTGSTYQRAVQVGPQGAVAPNVNNGKVFSADMASAEGTNVSNSGIRYNNGASLTASGQNPVVQDQFHISFRQIAQGATYNQAFYSVGNLTNLVANVVNPANTTTFVDADNLLMLGAAYRSDGTVNEYYQGQIAEVLIYNGVLTSYQMAQVGDYLSNKYALSFVAPEPATLILLGLGSFVAIRCRKA